MGMANSDDEAAIMYEYELMESIKRRTPEYHHVTHNMNEDMKEIYDSNLKSEYLNSSTANHYSPSFYDSNVQIETRPVRGDKFNNSDEDEYNKKITNCARKLK